MEAGVYLILVWAVLVLAGVAGWITNIFWTFQQTVTNDLALGVVGILVPIIGAFHGIYLWF